jgi:hypothetical protein
MARVDVNPGVKKREKTQTHTNKIKFEQYNSILPWTYVITLRWHKPRKSSCPPRANGQEIKSFFNKRITTNCSYSNINKNVIKPPRQPPNTPSSNYNFRFQSHIGVEAWAWRLQGVTVSMCSLLCHYHHWKQEKKNSISIMILAQFTSICKCVHWPQQQFSFGGSK